MILRKIFASFSVVCLVTTSIAQSNNRKIVLTGEVPPGFDKESINFLSFPVGNINFKEITMNNSEGKVTEGTVKWEIKADGPTRIFSPLLGNSRYFSYLAEPGDSLQVKYNGQTPVFSGKGAAYIMLLHQLKKVEDSLSKLPEKKSLSKQYTAASSLSDYLGWHNFLKLKSELQVQVVKSFRSKLTDRQYKDALQMVMKAVEKSRFWKFSSIRSNSNYDETNEYGLSNQDLCNLYDTTMNSESSKFLFQNNELDTDYFYQWSMLKLALYREKGKFFNTSKDDEPILGTKKEDAAALQYDLAKRKYAGVFRERLLAFAFCDVDGLFADVGFNSKVDSLLRDYYHQPGFTEYKAMVKAFEVRYRDKYTRQLAAPFRLTDKNGNIFSSNTLSGKLVVLDFWYTGCTGCVQMKDALKIVEDNFRADTNVVFVRVSSDKDFKVWNKSLEQEKFVYNTGIQLYTSGKGITHEILANYDISQYPMLYLISPTGTSIPYNHYTTDPRKNAGAELIKLIDHELAISKDGPYIFHKGQDSLISYEAEGNRIIKNTVAKSAHPEFYSHTDNNKLFSIGLKKTMDAEPSEFSQPSELFIFSDIEGNFKCLKELLVNNRIIDNRFNWTFGKGHLVFAGDMFDRGNQVTECLWLIYLLEEKAKAEGGYVHFILGNHEIMNLQADHRYVDEKYKQVARNMNVPIRGLYDRESELGRWLRSKNVMEKIGNLLIAHGGISSQLNNTPLNIAGINAVCRPYYDQIAPVFNDSTTKMLMGQHYSPFWYRGYYQGKTTATTGQIDSTLQKFQVSHIVTGHTVMADTISSYFDNKVINTDTKHAEGKSEALFISGDNFYRTNREGKRILLFQDRRK